jgi:predicted  nucleic acid-binding Zn ribbon protein
MITKKIVLALDIKNPPEEIVVSVETLEKLMEFAVTSLEEENGKLVMKLNLDRINISNQSANMFILCQNQQSRFMFAKFDSDAIENAIAYSGRIETIEEELDILDTVKKSRKIVKGEKQKYNNLIITFEILEKCLIKDNIADYTLDNIKDNYALLSKFNRMLNKELKK